MRVECKISEEYQEPYAVLHVNKITPSITEVIAVLENERFQTQPLSAMKERKTYFIPSAEISLIRTEGREIICYDTFKSRYTLDKPLYELEQLLGAAFIRISKSTIVNMNQISHVEASFNGTMELVMKNGIVDYITRSYRKGFKERLGLI